MRNLIAKRAAIHVKNFDEIYKAINSMPHMLDGLPAEQTIRKAMGSGDSTGSMFLDAALSIPKYVLRGGGSKVPKKKPGIIFKNDLVDTTGDRIDKKIKDNVWAYKKKIADADMKAGDYIANKTRAKKMFKEDIVFDGANNPGSPNTRVHLETNKLTAPFNKVKNKVVPMAGAFYLSSKLMPMEEGDDNASK